MAFENHSSENPSSAGNAHNYALSSAEHQQDPGHYRRQFEAICNNATVSLFIMDEHQQCIYMNPAAEKLTGYTLDEARGRPLHYVVHHTRPDGTPYPLEECPIDQAFPQNNQEQGEEIFVHKDGSFYPVAFTASPIREEGLPVGTIIEVRGIAGEKRAAEERERLLRLEQEASRLKDEFLAMLSHELRTPLTAILGWARMLSDGGLTPEQAASAIETIERNATLQAHLIEDILDVSRIITGKLRLEVHPVNLMPVIEAAVESVSPAAAARNIRLQRVLDSTASMVSGDPARLQQVMWNLLSNAIKFTPKGGRVQVRLERVNSHVEIIVTDTGKGIKPEMLPFVFDRFRQADSSTTRGHGGLGLGLAIVRHIVELHGGSVEAYSDGEGQGATFTVKLPLIATRPAKIHPASGEERVHPTDSAGKFAFECPPELNGIHILVVDDEADTRLLIEAVLEKCGARATAVGSVIEALDALTRLRPDVLISDIGMTGEDGYSLIKKVRELPAERGGQTPAAALTAYARVEDRMHALRSGFQIHMSKPVDPAELVTVIANLAGRFNSSGVKAKVV